MAPEPAEMRRSKGPSGSPSPSWVTLSGRMYWPRSGIRCACPSAFRLASKSTQWGSPGSVRRHTRANARMAAGRGLSCCTSTPTGCRERARSIRSAEWLAEYQAPHPPQRIRSSSPTTRPGAAQQASATIQARRARRPEPGRAGPSSTSPRTSTAGAPFSDAPPRPPGSEAHDDALMGPPDAGVANQRVATPLR